MSFVSNMYKAARIANTISKLNDPTKTARRVKNITLGRMLNKTGFWKWLWK